MTFVMYQQIRKTREKWREKRRTKKVNLQLVSDWITLHSSCEALACMIVCHVRRCVPHTYCMHT